MENNGLLIDSVLIESFNIPDIISIYIEKYQADKHPIVLQKNLILDSLPQEIRFRSKLFQINVISNVIKMKNVTINIDRRFDDSLNIMLQFKQNPIKELKYFKNFIDDDFFSEILSKFKIILFDFTTSNYKKISCTTVRDIFTYFNDNLPLIMELILFNYFQNEKPISIKMNYELKTYLDQIKNNYKELKIHVDKRKDFINYLSIIANKTKKPIKIRPFMIKFSREQVQIELPPFVLFRETIKFFPKFKYFDYAYGLDFFISICVLFGMYDDLIEKLSNLCLTKIIKDDF